MLSVALAQITDAATAEQLAGHYQHLAEQLANHAENLRRNHAAVLARDLHQAAAVPMARKLIAEGLARPAAIARTATRCRLTIQAVEQQLAAADRRDQEREKAALQKLVIQLKQDGLSVREIASETGVSKSTVARWISAGSKTRRCQRPPGQSSRY